MICRLLLLPFLPRRWQRIKAKARTIFSGRFNVTCADVRSLALPVMRHRLFTNFNADAEGVTPEQIIQRLVQEVPEPTPEDYAKPQAAAQT